MHAVLRSLRAVTAGLTLAAALPAVAQDYPPQPPPPPPESLPWAAPQQEPPAAPPAPPPARRVRSRQPVYRPDYQYGEQPPPQYQPARRPLPPEYQGEPAAPRAWYPQLEVAFHAGVASPGGQAYDGMAMSDLFGEQLALGLEVGVRTTPHLYVGLFAEGAFGGAGPAASGAGCAGVLTCDSGSVSGRVGAQLRFHLAPYGQLDPWIGYGVAVSGATVSGNDAYGSYSRTLSGIEYAKLSVGADLKLSRASAIGLYAEWTSGVFTQLEDREGGAVVASGSLAGSATHSWFTAGPRIRF